jgi:1-acyl-sn-glycerol-3-phosphate acyltransferase
MSSAREQAAIASAREDAISARIVDIVRELAVELHPRRGHTLRLDLDSDLDRDAGLDSLGRAELLLRLDRQFKVRLPDSLIGDARCPRDLLAGVLAASPTVPPPALEAIGRVALPAVMEPTAAATLIEVLATHVKAHASRPHILLWRGDDAHTAITYGELDRNARAIAHGLLLQGIVRGDRVAIMLPTEAAFFFTFFGVLLAGAVPVPIYPPFRRAQVEDHLRRQAGILRNAEARLLVTDEDIRRVGGLLGGLVESLEQVVTAAELGGHGALASAMLADRDATALIQYTSGSTGDPKGVVLAHANLLANIRAMGEAIEASSADVFVSWLPLYHDMGLIGAWLGCLYYGAPTVIMPPLAFLADPARWLRAIHRHHATLSAAPNFAFELCLKNVRDEDIAGLDLSTLRMVVNGADPVSPATIARFAERFAPHGFRAGAMAPVYGLAECSVGLAFPPVGRIPIIDRVSRTALARDGIAQLAVPGDKTAIEFVACGRPLPRHEIRIVDDGGRELPERHQGRLQFKGPSATKAYFRNAEKTRGLFDGEWLESGDLAYVAEGDVYITGRTKDMIKRAGRNIYPHELEEFVGGIAGVRRGCVAAFPSPDPRTGTERLIVLAETRLTEPGELTQLQRQISDASTSLLDLQPDEILLAPPHTVPKTSSGKIRRSTARALYEAGALGRPHRALWWQLLRLEAGGLVNRCQRAARTFGAMAYAAYWWCVVGVIAMLTWPLVVLLPRRPMRHAVIGAAARTLFRLTGTPLKISPQAKVPDRAVILVVNHSSYLDGAVLSAAIPGELSFVAKGELAGQAVAGPFLRRIGTLFVHRLDPKAGVEDTEVTVAAAKAGERIVSFPEGTLVRMPGLLGFRLGAFLAAAQAGVPVVPVAIRGTRSILRGGQWRPRRGEISVDIGAPIKPDGADFAAAVRLRDAARAFVLAHCREPDLAEEQVDIGAWAQV